ncbi:MAG: hypothetical protein JJE22_03460 [Bacteroidia bacterium]|nr:hypothetical protein [Bacteroidia bacterium]
MAETLGMLCDKLTIVKLKQYHTKDKSKLVSLQKQAKQLQGEINEYIADAKLGKIPLDKLTFTSNKIYNKQKNKTGDVKGNFGEVISQLADVNCNLWHQQEKVYEFEKVPAKEKNRVIKKLATLNLDRNKCIDRIDNLLAGMIANK